MSCKICGRGSCASWMHSCEQQEAHEERQKMSDDVDTLRCTMTLTDSDGYVYWFNNKSELLAWQPPKGE